jgi:heptosyltransferase I
LRILIIKMSSLGDVIHVLPALTDAMHAIPGLQADWVIEEAFAEIPAWHPAVHRVIPVAIRRWRNHWFGAWQRGELKLLRKALAHTHYDLVIDAQGLLKSALVGLLAQGPVAGYDRHSIKESAASVFYRHRFGVSTAEHAVLRIRQLFAKALGYRFDPSLIDYGMKMPVAMSGDTEQQPVVMFLHGTTWESKHWPEHYWREMARIATASGYKVRIPWGSAQEQQRAVRIADNQPYVTVMEKSTLSGLASELDASAGVVSVDTGLGHLAAALGKPTVTIYGATNPSLSGTFGHHQLRLKSDLACSPCMRRQCRYKGVPLSDQFAEESPFVVQPACYRSAPPAEVFAHLQRVMTQVAEARS